MTKTEKTSFGCVRLNASCCYEWFCLLVSELTIRRHTKQQHERRRSESIGTGHCWYGGDRIRQKVHTSEREIIRSTLKPCKGDITQHRVSTLWNNNAPPSPSSPHANGARGGGVATPPK